MPQSKIFKLLKMSKIGKLFSQMKSTGQLVKCPLNLGGQGFLKRVLTLKVIVNNF